MRSSRRRLSSPIQIVVTPGSGNGRALATAQRVREALRTRGHRTRLAVFADLERLRQWAATDPAPFSHLVCIGGDGTLSATAVAAMRRSVPFLPVPSGFGNLVAHALRHSARVDRVVDLVERGEIVHLDVGLRDGVPFLCQESFGLLDQIQQSTEDTTSLPRARWSRTLAYYRTAIREFRDARLRHIRVTVDGRLVARDAVIATVANVETYGPWLRLTPDASPIDGLFDVFVMRAARAANILARLVKCQLRLPGSEAGTSVYRGRCATVAAPHRPVARLELIPRRLPVLVSSAAAEALHRNVARAAVRSQSAPSREVA